MTGKHYCNEAQRIRLIRAAERLAHIERLADTGTAASFAALSDDDKLRWFVTTGQRDREQTERIKELEASLATIQATKDFDLDRWLDWQDEKERMLADLSEAQRMGLESATVAHRLEAELAHIRTDRDAAAEACRMLHADKTKLEAENQRLREALDAIRQYGSDTLSGRADGGADDRAWQRAAVLEMTRRADAALSQPAAEQPAGDWHCPNCGYIDAQRVTIEEACDTCRQPVEWHDAHQQGAIGSPRQQLADAQAAQADNLPLMARREWIDPKASYVCVSSGGRETHAYEDLPVGNMYREWGWDIYRIADTDEHGLPVIERTADMPEGAKYRGWTERTRDWTYYVCFIEKHAHNRVERIEDYTERDDDLPLMARRDYMPAWANFVAWDENGDCWAYENDPYRLAEWWTIRHNDRLREISGWYGWYPGDWRESLHRVADTDEHGLPVIPRTADMPAIAKVRSRPVGATEDEWLYEAPLCVEHAARPGWETQRIEDYNAHAEPAQREGE